MSSITSESNIYAIVLTRLGIPRHTFKIVEVPGIEPATSWSVVSTLTPRPISLVNVILICEGCIYKEKSHGHIFCCQTVICSCEPLLLSQNLIRAGNSARMVECEYRTIYEFIVGTRCITFSSRNLLLKRAKSLIVAL